MDNKNAMFFDSWHKNEEVPFEIKDKEQIRCENLNTLFENHFSLNNFESTRVFLPLIRKMH
jgi:hypothetical protein